MSVLFGCSICSMLLRHKGDGGELVLISGRDLGRY
jgi:hypothetical protein